MVSLDGLNESEKSLVAFALMQRLCELFDRKPELNASLRLMVVMDEVWQFFRRERDFTERKESSLEKVVRLGRKYGFGLVVSTQQVEDMPKVFFNSCSLMMLHQQRESAYMGRNLLELNRFESAYLRSAAQGEMLLFDRGMAQRGQTWPEYVKASPLADAEIACLAKKYAPYTPSAIREAEMPIEMQDSFAPEATTGRPDILKGLDIPSVVVYRFLVALANSGSLKGANRTLKEKGWVTSDTTIYGNKSKPSLLDRAKSSGYVSEEGSLTKKALDVVDPDLLIARQGIYAGNEEHKELMRKTIRMVQDRGEFAFVPKDKDGFDVGEHQAVTKSAWDFGGLTAYECQTSAVKEELEKAVDKSRRTVAKLVFVVSGAELGKTIGETTANQYEIMVI
ncbi:Uncharacterised protein [uncultured archaeon]|nr:Uncharacterised protein [uncultured archaeon]